MPQVASPVAAWAIRTCWPTMPGRSAMPRRSCQAHCRKGVTFPDEPLADPVDRLMVEKLQRLNIVPAGLCGDADFLRRAYLDVTGQLPPPDEVRRFLADPSPDKRAAAIDRLLADPLHAAVWATKMCDAMGADNRTMYDESVYRIHDWLRNRFERNVPWNEIVRGALTGTHADGRSFEELEAENARRAERRKLASRRPEGRQEARAAGRAARRQAVASRSWPCATRSKISRTTSSSACRPGRARGRWTRSRWRSTWPPAFSACGSNVPSATSIRTTAGRSRTSSASPRRSPTSTAASIRSWRRRSSTTSTAST